MDHGAQADRDALLWSPAEWLAGMAIREENAVPRLILAGKSTSMNSIPSASEATLCDEDVLTCVRVLRAIETDRSHLTRLTQEQRRELLTLAGLVAKPERHDLVKMAKAFRKADRAATKEHDRRVVEQTGLRVQRRST